MENETETTVEVETEVSEFETFQAESKFGNFEISGEIQELLLGNEVATRQGWIEVHNLMYAVSPEGVTDIPGYTVDRVINSVIAAEKFKRLKETMCEDLERFLQVAIHLLDSNTLPLHRISPIAGFYKDLIALQPDSIKDNITLLSEPFNELKAKLKIRRNNA